MIMRWNEKSGRNQGIGEELKESRKHSTAWVIKANFEDILNKGIIHLSQVKTAIC